MTDNGRHFKASLVGATFIVKNKVSGLYCFLESHFFETYFLEAHFLQTHFFEKLIFFEFVYQTLSNALVHLQDKVLKTIFAFCLFQQVRKKVTPQQQNHQQNLENSKSHCTSEPRLNETETPQTHRRYGSTRRAAHNSGKSPVHTPILSLACLPPHLTGT